MHFQKTITLAPETAFDEAFFQAYLVKFFQVNQPGRTYTIKKRSIDARGKRIRVHIAIDFYIDEVPPERKLILDQQDVSTADQVVIVGSGPAGLFAALELINQGIKPIVLERGKDVRARRRDLVAINKYHVIDPDSNYCFGEGGAGTYSDGKLYTRSKKRGDVRQILEILIAFGANPDILYDAHPHIGTNKLPPLIANIREHILASGGEIHFNVRVNDFIIDRKNEEITGVKTSNGETWKGSGVILATGHSARDIFELLVHRDIAINEKPFAMGVRVEHPQGLIDSIQYHCDIRDPYLPAASYSMVSQTMVKDKKRGVFSFCMCPGGFIVPSATAPGEVVVNGMSPSRRNSKYANSGIVVAIENDDFQSYQKGSGSLSGMHFQRDLEQKAFHMAGSEQSAPAQRLQDFIDRRVSSSLPDSSFQPGLASVDMWELLPGSMGLRLAEGLQSFGIKMKGYLTNEAVIVGVESRTSSPVRIPRNKETYEHIQIKRFYPCGEGAGYAGGIISAAMDGKQSALKLAQKYCRIR